MVITKPYECLRFNNFDSHLYILRDQSKHLHFICQPANLNWLGRGKQIKPTTFSMNDYIEEEFNNMFQSTALLTKMRLWSEQKREKKT